MQLLDQIRRTSDQAAASGGPTFLVPDADPRWRPAPDPGTGAVRVDPEFSLPSAAGMLTWALFYDSANGATAGEYGYGRSGSFPLRLVNNAPAGPVTVMHDDGAIRTYRLSGGSYVADPQNGDTLVTLTDGTWQETLAASGLQYHFPAGNVSTLSYRATPQGQRLTYAYAASAGGTLETVTVQDPTGRLVTLTCNSDGRVQTVQDWAGRGLMVLTYDGNGNLTELWEQEGVLTRFAYDSSHRLTYILDPAGFVTTYTYDTSSRVTSRSVDGNLSQYDYGTVGATGYIDPLGYRWTHLVDTGGYPAGMIDPLGNQSIYTYINHRPVAFDNPLGQTVTFSYDTNGYLLSRQDELGYRTTFIRDTGGNGNIVSVIDALNNITNLDYGATPALRQLATITDPLGNQTNFGYDSYGFPHYIQDAAGYRTTLNWTNLGVLATVQNARGFVWTYTYL